MKILLEDLYNHHILDKYEAKQLLIDIVNGSFNSSQIASILTILIMRKISPLELIGFREALLELAINVNLSDIPTIDVCGTGGDGKNTFNISTLTSFVVAGSGIPVTKHGNYGISSICGSSNVLENLGVKFSTNEDLLRKQLDTANICFLHAPLFHPALKYVAPIRSELGVKTFFNMLGPLVNPASPKAQLVGVFNLELARIYQQIFQTHIHEKFSIIHTIGGYDEISLTNETKVFTSQNEFWINADSFGLQKVNSIELYGGNSIQDVTLIFMNILNGKGTESQNKIVLVNSALAIQTYKPFLSLNEAYDLAKESLMSGSALLAFTKLKNIQ